MSRDLTTAGPASAALAPRKPPTPAFVGVVQTLAVTLPPRQPLEEVALLGYWLALEDVELEDLAAATRTALKTCEWLPPPVKLRELAKEAHSREVYRRRREAELAEKRERQARLAAAYPRSVALESERPREWFFVARAAGACAMDLDVPLFDEEGQHAAVEAELERREVGV